MAERGQDYILNIGAVPVGKLTSINLSLENELIETNNFDSPDNAESIAGMTTTELDGEALYVYDDAGQEAIWTAFEDKTAATAVTLTSLAGTVGVYEWTGNLWITSLELAFEMNEVVQLSLSGRFTGAVTRAAIAA